MYKIFKKKLTHVAFHGPLAAKRLFLHADWRLVHKTLCCLLAIVALLPLRAQTDLSDFFDRENQPLTAEENRFLTNFARERGRAYWLERDSAIQFATRIGRPVHGRVGDGSFSLQGFDGSGQLHYYSSFNAMSAAVLGSDRLHQGGGLGAAVTGAGSVLGMWETGRPRLSHVEFGGRVTQYDSSTEDMDDHASHVAGTMVAAGQNADAKGMAYQANLRAYDANNDIAEMASAVQAYNLRVSNHSYGAICGWRFFQGQWYWFGNTNISQTTDFKFGLYNSDARDIDQVTYNAPFYLPVFAAGNDRDDTGPPGGTQHLVQNSAGQWVSSTATRARDGNSQGYECLPPDQTAKNALVVGAVEAETDGNLLVSSMSDFSSWGPTDDGRIKPDVVSRGVDVFSAGSESNAHYYNNAGTSMAAPSVAGSLALLLQHYNNTNPGFTIRASALKALVIHTASDEDGPDYRSGWGLVNIYRAADHISRHVIAESTDRLISRDSLTNGSQRDRLYYHDGQRPFVATLVWTDPAGPLSANTLNPTTSRLVHDLDLRLISETTGTVYRPWVLNPSIPGADAFKGDNFRDNVEQIYEADLPPGLYTLRISHKGSLQQPVQHFSLMVSGRTNLHTACNGSLSDGSGDQDYLDDTSYSWTIKPADASRVTLSFDAFNTESGYDFVRIYDGESPQDELIGQYSGSSLPPAVTAQSGQMYITFTSDESVRKPGWSASYSCAQCDPPFIVSVGAITSQSAVISWNASPGAASYTLRLRIEGSSTWTTQQWTTTSASQSGLLPATTYEVQIRTNCSNDESSFTESTFFTTAAATCNAPVASELSHSMVTVSAAQLATSSAGNLFQFRYKLPAASSWTSLSESTASTAALSGLLAATTYEYQVRRRCTNNVWSDWSPTGVFTTASASMELQPSVVSQDASQGTAMVSLLTNCSSWSISNIPAWVSISPQSGSGNTSLSIAFTANNTATARMAVVDITGCNLNRSITLSQQGCALPAASPLISLTGGSLLCDGQSVSLQASGSCDGCTIVWSNGQSGSTINVGAPGQYTAFFRNSCGDGPAAAVSIAAGSAPTAAPVVTVIGNTQLCQGQTTTLFASGNCQGCTLHWSNGQTGPSIQVQNAGAYYAYYRNDCGDGPISAVTSITTDIIYVPVFLVNNQCFLAAPNGGAYQWYLNNQPIPEATGQFWMAQVTGYYTLRMTNPAGCTGTSAPLFVNACVTADEDPQEKLAVALFPNPASDRLWLRHGGSGLLTDLRLDLYGPDGRWIGCLLQLAQLPGGSSFELPLPQLPTAVYYYKLRTTEAVVWGSLLIVP